MKIDESPEFSSLAEQRIAELEQDVAALQKRLILLEKNSIRLDKILQPSVSFVVACAVTAAFGLFCFAVFEGQELWHYLTYVVPIAIPFVGFIFDRFQLYLHSLMNKLSLSVFVLDLVVLFVSLIRAVYALPHISGHAAFLAFALLTVRSWWVRAPVIIVLAQVVYLKAFVWHDATLYGGLLFGSLTALLWWGLMKKTAPLSKRKNASISEL